ncbi:MSHA biogenesis protein MshG [Aliidiomarina taiwanensis]|uniref:MSHA biogenesis protein MshG n=1 Tax=Aliidiomarina taiwanensis TaxID=946228 RepID=A0A432X7N7_9GAMM|nr:type II secretion system F family protein [Aliidiomarina taiwanensis]RUO42826.1 MSHA biogenesis protein MshG [Aliidiomarina taiwanensis]
MSSFRYQGRDRQGNMVKGTLNGANESAVAEQLMRQGIVPVQIIAGTQGSGSSFGSINMKELLVRQLPLPDLVMFTRQMYALTKAGVSMLRAVQGLAENASNKQLGAALQGISDELERGRSLSAAMSDYPKVFPRLVVAVVHVGENTGRLEESFQQLAFYLENEQETRKRIKQATRYPSFVVVSLIIAVFVLNMFVIPNFVSMFTSMNVELPLVTRMLLASSNFFVNYWHLLLLGVAGTVAWVSYWVRQEHGRAKWDHWKIKLPIMGDIIERSLLGRFCRSFSVMLNAGVPLTQALNLVSEALDNRHMATRIIEMRRGIERGESLSRVSRSSQLFSALVLQMIAVGEETGNLDDLLLESAEYYEREVDYDLKNLLSKIEPILIGGVALIVGFLAMGIFLPMWSMMDMTGSL